MPTSNSGAHWNGGTNAAGQPVIRGVNNLQTAATMQDWRAKSGLGGVPTAAELAARAQTQAAADKLKAQTIFGQQYENWRKKQLGLDGSASPNPTTTPNTATTAAAPKSSSWFGGAGDGQPTVKPVGDESRAQPQNVMQYASASGTSVPVTGDYTGGWSKNGHVNWGSPDDAFKSQDPETAARTSAAVEARQPIGAANTVGAAGLSVTPPTLDANSQRIVNEQIGAQPTVEMTANRKAIAAKYPLSGEFTKENPDTGVAEVTPEAKAEIDADNAKKLTNKDFGVSDDTPPLKAAKGGRFDAAKKKMRPKMESNTVLPRMAMHAAEGGRMPEETTTSTLTGQAAMAANRKGYLATAFPAAAMGGRIPKAANALSPSPPTAIKTLTGSDPNSTGQQAKSNVAAQGQSIAANAPGAPPVLAGEAGPELKMNDDGSMEPIPQPTILPPNSKPGAIIPHKVLAGMKAKFDKKKIGPAKKAADGGRIGSGWQPGGGSAMSNGFSLRQTNQPNTMPVGTVATQPMSVMEQLRQRALGMAQPNNMGAYNIPA